ARGRDRRLGARRPARPHGGALPAWGRGRRGGAARMSDPLDALDYYSLLQVAPDATADAIRAAFHQFALRYHPDSYTMASAEDRARVNRSYRRGGEAYRVLSNSTWRAAYDAGLAEGRLRHQAPSGTDEATARTQGAKRSVNAKARPFWTKAQAAIRDGQWG